VNFWYPCTAETTGDRSKFYTGCYFGRGAIQISYNYNYGQFQQWLMTQGIQANLLQVRLH
jgi:hypothetical protein